MAAETDSPCNESEARYRDLVDEGRDLETYFEKSDLPSEDLDTLQKLDNMPIEVPMIGQDPGLDLMERALRKSLRGTSFKVLQEFIFPHVSEFYIPLCRVLPMTEVRIPIKADIEKLKGEFVKGYRPESACFYMALKNFSMLEREVLHEERAGWSDLWREEDMKFESFIQGRLELHALSNRYFFIWNGNHRHVAWMNVISTMHRYDGAFHTPVRAVLLQPTMQNRHILLNAMTEWNK